MGLRKIAGAISPFVSRSYNAVWRWGKRLKGLRNTFASKCRVSMYLVDDTLVFVGDRRAWMIVAYELFHKKLLGIWLTSEKKDHVIACFLNELVKRFGRYPVYTDGALYYESACRILGLEHHVYTFGSWLHTVIESVICTQIKDMTRTFDNYFPCMKKICMWEHVWSGIKLRILFNEEETINMIRKLVGVIKIE